MNFIITGYKREVKVRKVTKEDDGGKYEEEEELHRFVFQAEGNAATRVGTLAAGYELEISEDTVHAGKGIARETLGIDDEETLLLFVSNSLMAEALLCEQDRPRRQEPGGR